MPVVFSLIFSFLKSYWREVLIGLLVLLIVGAIGFVHHEITSQREKIQSLTEANQKLTADNKTLTDNNQKLQTSITTLNSSIDALSAQSNKTQQDFSKLSTNVQQSSANLAAKLNKIATTKAPVSCDDSIKYLRDAAKGF